MTCQVARRNGRKGGRHDWRWSDDGVRACAWCHQTFDDVQAEKKASAKRTPPPPTTTDTATSQNPTSTSAPERAPKSPPGEQI